MNSLAPTASRVPANTAKEVNDRIQRFIEGSIAYFTAHREQIPRRLAELDREWDIERALETGSSGLTLVGLLLGIGVSRKWLLLSLLVQGFFMQHALQGWCPPLPLLRRLGIRTADEINQERHALRNLQARRSPRHAADPAAPSSRPQHDTNGSKRRSPSSPAAEG